MASIDMNYWIDDNNWKEARKLYDSTNYPEGSSTHERLRDALKLMQQSLGSLHQSLQHAPAECYQNFYQDCFDKDAAVKVNCDLEHFRAKYMSEEDMPQGLIYYLQRVTYRLYERGFLRFDLYPLQNSHGRKFEFDFNLLYREGVESEETKFFCVCLNHYLIMPDKYTVYLNKEKLGKYLFDHYINLTDNDFLTISYYDVAISRYNHEVEIRGLLESEQENETEKNNLKQPAEEELNYFAPQKNLQALLSRSWFSEVRMKEAYDQAWTDAFVKALMASEWRDDIARQWAATGQRSKIKQIKGYVLGLLADACVLRGSYNQIATKANVTDDPRIFSRYMAEGKKQPYAQWVMRYITEH